MSRSLLVGLSVATLTTLACAHPSSDPVPVTSSEVSGGPVEPDVGVSVTPVDGTAPLVFESEYGQYGFRSESGEVVIAAEWAAATEFVDQVAAVADDEDGWWFIDRTGATLAPAFNFDNGADPFVEDRARIVQGDFETGQRFGFLSSRGEVVIPPTWGFALPFSEGLAAVCEGCQMALVNDFFVMQSGTWGYIGLDGAVVIAPRFSKAEPFANGQARVEADGRSFTIGRDGAELAD